MFCAHGTLVVFHLVLSLGSVTVNLDYEMDVSVRKGSTDRKRGIQPGLLSSSNQGYKNKHKPTKTVIIKTSRTTILKQHKISSGATWPCHAFATWHRTVQNDTLPPIDSGLAFYLIQLSTLSTQHNTWQSVYSMNENETKQWRPFQGDWGEKWVFGKVGGAL